MNTEMIDDFEQSFAAFRGEIDARRREILSIFEDAGIHKRYLPKITMSFEGNDPLNFNIQWVFFFQHGKGLGSNLDYWSEEQIEIVIKFLRAYRNRHSFLSDKPFLIEGISLERFEAELLGR